MRPRRCSRGRYKRRPLAWRALESAERVAALGALVALTPLLAAIAIAVMLLSAKAPLVAHRLIGKPGRELWLLKFRTMWGRGSTRSGRLRFLEFLRESEVPECRFVGPRPLTPAELATHYRDATAEVLELEPGLIEQWNMLVGTIPRASS